MPELPEVETILCGIKKQILNIPILDVIIRQYQLRWPIPKNIRTKLLNNIFLNVTRRGKYLLLNTQNGALILHLGMSGRLQILPKDHEIGKHEHVTIIFADGKSLCFIDPRRFGSLLWTSLDPKQHKLLKFLGPEPLSTNFTGKYLFSKSRNRKVAVKQFLMNSKVVVGVGNIYANEALFLAKIHPQKSSQNLTLVESELLVKSIKIILKNAIKKGGTTIRDYITSDGKTGYFQNELQVYGRSGLPCINCVSLLQEIRMGGRSTVFCPKCQSL
jgi:formamidopyrimidine-DNA glycosylase